MCTRATGGTGARDEAGEQRSPLRRARVCRRFLLTYLIFAPAISPSRIPLRNKSSCYFRTNPNHKKKRESPQRRLSLAFWLQTRAHRTRILLVYSSGPFPDFRSPYSRAFPADIKRPVVYRDFVPITVASLFRIFTGFQLHRNFFRYLIVKLPKTL